MDSKHKEICGARCPNQDGGPDYICQRPKHKLYLSVKHWDNRDGLFMWTQGGADRIAAEIAGKKAVTEAEKAHKVSQ